MNETGFFSNGSESLKDFADSVGAKLVMPSSRLLDGKVTRGGEVSGGRNYAHGADVATTWRQARIAPQTTQQQAAKLRRAK